MKQIKKIWCFFFIAAMLVSGASAATQPPEDLQLIPMGHAVGIQIHTGGVTVVGLTSVVTADGDKTPATDAGLKVGDVITHVNQQAIDGAQPFYDAVQATKGERVVLTGERGGKALTIELKAVQAKVDDCYRIGVWVRDHMTGIGTLTYYNPTTHGIGALGHGIHDAESGKLIPLASGTISAADIVDVKRGVAGDPGELRGTFDASTLMGTLFANTESGIFGRLDGNKRQTGHLPMKLARPHEVREGAAQIYCQVEGDTVGTYDIEIVRLLNSRDTRNLIIRITDEKLLTLTGGIVQGMSGSPIIQNGKLVGAVTHVFVNDAARGYGVFIDNMLRAEQKARDAKTEAIPKAA